MRRGTCQRFAYVDSVKDEGTADGSTDGLVGSDWPLRSCAWASFSEACVGFTPGSGTAATAARSSNQQQGCNRGRLSEELRESWTSVDLAAAAA